ncbi:Excision repair cross-complementing rodent repair deficiency, complementation group 5 [Cichlidogyrus casuarinus]|uniref:Excision repair cross-complementing rodent repair deficiency, complementation group 5 n=1 Tax=Cichlidogyrus casuarinus TaxID=1844966 RepID=A0ABD2PR65_9PLAT
MNIWLHQASKARVKGRKHCQMILYKRIARLFYYNIKPVFVFDGEVPLLKRQIIESRRETRVGAARRADKMKKRLVKRLLLRLAQESLKEDKSESGKEIAQKLSSTIAGVQEDEELFQVSQEPLLDAECREDYGRKWDELAYCYLQNLRELDEEPEAGFQSDSFKALPKPVQLRVIRLARRKMNDRSFLRPEQSDYQHLEEASGSEFSQHQMDKLLRRRELASKESEVSSEMLKEESIGLLNSLQQSDAEVVQTLRIQSREKEHALFIDRIDPISAKKAVNDRLMAMLNPKQRSQIVADPSSSKSLTNEPKIEAQVDESPESKLVICFSQPPAELAEENRAQIKSENEPKINAFRDESLVSKLKKKQIETEPEISALGDQSLVLQLEQKEEENNAKINAPGDVSLVSNLAQKEERNELEMNPLGGESLVSKFAEKEERIEPKINHLDDESLVSKFGKEKEKLEPILDASSEELVVSQLEQEMDEKKLEDESSEWEQEEENEARTILGAEPLVLRSPVRVLERPQNEAELDVIEEEALVEEASIESDSEMSFESVSEKAQSVESSEDDLEVDDEVLVQELENSDSDLMILFGLSTGESPAKKGTKLGLILGKYQMIQGMFTNFDPILSQKGGGYSARQAQQVSDQLIEDAKLVARMFGCPCVESPEEAEAQCAHLELQGLVDVIATEDSDVWLFGASKVCRHLFGGDKDDFPTLYEKEAMERRLGLTRSGLISVAMLCGSDYTAGVRNVGPVTAMEVLSQFGQQEPQDANVEGSVMELLNRFKDWNEKQSSPQSTVVMETRRKWPKFQIEEQFPRERIVKAYTSPRVSSLAKKELQWGEMNREQIVEFLIRTFSWSRDYAQQNLDLIVREHAKKRPTMTKITDYLHPAKDDDDDVILVPSKRIRMATAKILQKDSPTKTSQPKRRRGKRKCS